MTEDELLVMPDDGNHYELVQGVLVPMTPSAYLPGAVTGRVLIALGAFVVPRGLGDVGSQLLDENGRLDGDHVLPGFSIVVRDLLPSVEAA